MPSDVYGVFTVRVRIPTRTSAVHALTDSILVMFFERLKA